jgi:hypothetical protein
MPQIAREEFERLPLRVHAFLAGVPLHDTWAVDLPRTRGGITTVLLSSAIQFQMKYVVPLSSLIGTQRGR